MPIILAVGAGLILGSFLSVLLSRWPCWHGVVGGRSKCPHCAHQLAWYELVPLASWVGLRGRCRACHARISALYPALELAVAGVLGAYAYRFGVHSTWSVVDLAILFGLVALFFFDVQHMVLPDGIVFPLAVLALMRVLHYPEVLNPLVSGGVLALAFGALFFFSHGRWLGFGDVKFALVVGLLFGFPLAWWVTLAAIWTGALVGVILIVVKRATMQTALPLGAFWTAAAIFAFVFA
jgi:leader peptidase (prepilin peptidase) / N-methyltransferase